MSDNTKARTDMFQGDLQYPEVDPAILIAHSIFV